MSTDIRIGGPLVLPWADVGLSPPTTTLSRRDHGAQIGGSGIKAHQSHNDATVGPALGVRGRQNSVRVFWTTVETDALLTHIHTHTQCTKTAERTRCYKDMLLWDLSARTLNTCVSEVSQVWVARAE